MSLNDFLVEIETNSKEHYAFLCIGFNPWFSEDRFLDDNSIKTVAVRSNEMLIGMSCYRIKKDEILNLYTYISPNFRKRGINRNIKSLIEINNSDKKQIVSHVREQNIPSIKSLLSSGYVIDPDFNKHYSDGSKMLRMFKVLGAECFTGSGSTLIGTLRQ